MSSSERKLVIVHTKENDEKFRIIFNFLENVIKKLRNGNYGKVKCVCGEQRKITGLSTHFKSKRCLQMRQKLEITLYDKWFLSKLDKSLLKSQNIDTKDKKEEWKDMNVNLREKNDIKNIYEVSSFGRVRNKNTKRILKSEPDKNSGYCICKLNTHKKKSYGQRVHVIVAWTFISREEGKTLVDHIDGDKSNNSVENLRWATCQENSLNRKYTSNISVCQFDKNSTFIRRWKSITDAASKLNLDPSEIKRICEGETIQENQFAWKYEKDLSKVELKDEIWKQIPILEGYMASNKGRIKGEANRRTFGTEVSGYMQYSHKGKNYKVHRLICFSFYGKPKEKSVVDHKDRNRYNNILENLEWVTAIENSRRACSISIIQFDKKGKYIGEFSSIKEIENQLGIPSGNIVKVCKGERISAGGYLFKYKKDYKKDYKKEFSKYLNIQNSLLKIIMGYV